DWSSDVCSSDLMHGLADGDPKIAIERLQRLTEAGNPWRASALELTAAAKLKGGDRNGALEIYKTLADDLTAPQRLRARAAEMAAALASSPPLCPPFPCNEPTRLRCPA